MKRTATILFIFLGLFLNSCQKDEKRVVVIISEVDSLNAKNKNSIQPIFYAKSNFIVTNDNHTYYFTNKKYIEFRIDSYGYDFSKPEYLKILPSDLREIQVDSLYLLLKKIHSEYTRKRIPLQIMIASDIDTIRNNSLVTFNQFSRKLNDDSLRIIYNYRLMTEEERVVLKAKRENKTYNPDSVKWKNGFGGMKFTKPKLDK